MWNVFDYERKRHGLAPLRVYYARLARNVGIALATTGIAHHLPRITFRFSPDHRPVQGDRRTARGEPRRVCERHPDAGTLTRAGWWADSRDVCLPGPGSDGTETKVLLA